MVSHTKDSQFHQRMLEMHEKEWSNLIGQGSDSMEQKMTVEDQERICSVLRDSVLSLCQENYRSAIEVDGLICISVLNSTEQHVVKIHDLIRNGQLFSSTTTRGKNLVKPKKSKADLYSPKTDNQPLPVQIIQNSASFSQHNMSSNKTNIPAISESYKAQATDENSARFPFLIQTLKESNRNQNRASSASPTVPFSSQGQQNRSLHETIASSPPVIDTERPASSLLKLLSSHKKQEQTLQTEYLNKTKTTSLIHQKDVNSESILSVKQEPVDEEMTEQQGSGYDMEGSGRNSPEEPVQEQSESMRVKPEPEWNEEDYGGANSSYQTDSGTASNVSTSTSKKSILAKILKGKEEAYSKSRQALTKKAKNGQTGSEKSSDKVDEQDNSLLYRLPFTTFHDLFPTGPSSDPGSEGHQKDSKRKEKKIKSSDLDVLMRKMLEDPNRHDRSSDKKKQPPRKKKRTVQYEEFDDSMTSEDTDLSDIPNDNEDDNYVPSANDNEDDHKFSMSLRAKRPRKYEKKRSVAVKSTSKQSIRNFSGKSVGEIEAGPLTGLRFSCHHCSLVFGNRKERDQHEEQDCIRELIICDICKGYFANSSSRNKHLFEVHNIFLDEQKNKIEELSKGASEELKTIYKSEYEFETLRDDGVSDGNGLQNISVESVSSISQPQFDLEASAYKPDNKMTLVTKFIVPYSVQNDKTFIKCPLCVNLFSDVITKDQHLQKKHKIANQIDNGDGTVSLQLAEQCPSNVPPVYVKFEEQKQTSTHIHKSS